MNLDVKAVFGALTTSRYIALSAVTLCIYDWTLVIEDEVMFFSITRLSRGKVMYYLARIATLLGLVLGVFHIVGLRPPLTNQLWVLKRYDILMHCQGFLWFSSILQAISIFISYWLLTLRLLALYKSRRVIVWLLYIALFATYLTSLGFLIHTLFSHAHSTIYFASVHLCVPLGLPSSFQAVFEVPLAFEVVLFVMVVWRAWEDWRTQRSGPLHAKTTPLLWIMYRDGIFYFCAMVGVRIWNIYIYAARPLEEMYMGAYIMWSLITILSSRIYLNIVREAQRKHISDTRIQPVITWTQKTLTSRRNGSHTDIHNPREGTLSQGSAWIQLGNDIQLNARSKTSTSPPWPESKVLDICR